jgi:uncharacterized RDD family membrane protein YckC
MPYRGGFWVRTAAAAIDVVAMLLIGVGAVALTAAALSAMSYSVADNLWAALMYAAWLAYSSFELWTPATPGKMVFRLRVSNNDGTPADFWRRFLRWSTKWCWLALTILFLLTQWSPFYVLGSFISGIVTIGCFFAANEDRLTWLDEWAHTAVCRHPRRARTLGRMVPAAPPPLPPAKV